MELTNLEGLMQKIGVESVVIKSGANKDIGSPFRRMKEEERTLLQNVLDDMHHQFIDAVSEGRSLSVETVRALADGRVFTGRQAKDLGLIDELGSFEYAVRKTADLAGLKGEPRIVEAKKKISFLDFFRGISSMIQWERHSSPITSIHTSYLFSF
jgi:protease-4